MKYSKKAKAEKVKNQVFAAYWGNFSSDSNESEQGKDISIMIMEDKVQVLDSLFALMEDTKINEDKLMTLLDIKENLNDYSLSKLRSLAFVMVDF